MKRPMVFVFALVSILLSTSVGYAQDAQAITYGQTVSGDITTTNAQVNYQFTGSKGDVILAEMAPTDFMTSLLTPVLLIYDDHNTPLGDTTESFSFPNAVLAFELPEDGTYRLLATRDRNSEEGDKGDAPFTLRLLKLSPLGEGQSISADAGTKLPTSYFLVREVDHPLKLTYQKVGGDFAPDIVINTLRRGSLTEAVTLGGNSLQSGQVNFPGDAGLYVISVGQRFFTPSFGDKQQSKFTLTIS